MIDNITVALQISMTGILLTFGVILLLWFVMEGLARLTDKSEMPVTDTDEVESPSHPLIDPKHEQRRVAAAVAVAIALAREKAATALVAPQSPISNINPWQTVHRSRQFQQGGPYR